MFVEKQKYYIGGKLSARWLPFLMNYFLSVSSDKISLSLLLHDNINAVIPTIIQINDFMIYEFKRLVKRFIFMMLLILNLLQKDSFILSFLL